MIRKLGNYATHVTGKRHRDMASASSSSTSVTSFFRPQASHGAIQAEALWSTFVVEHNLAFKVRVKGYLMNINELLFPFISSLLKSMTTKS